MPPSDPTELEALCRQLDRTDPDERATLAPQVQKLLLDEIETWGDLTADVLERCLPLCSGGDPATRSVGVFVASHVAIYGEDYVDDQGEVAALVFEALGDESAVVRHAAANSSRLDDIVAKALADEAYRPVPRAQMAERLFDLLHDPDPAVRRRVGKVVSAHGGELLGVHADPATAVETLLDTLGDPVNGYGTYARPVVAPRHAALMTLTEGIDAYDASLLADHTVAIAACLHDDRRRGRFQAARLLDTATRAGGIPVTEIVDDVVSAAQRRTPEKLNVRFPPLALRVALNTAHAVDPVYDYLWARVTAANTETDRWDGSDPFLVALSRLVRAADQSFAPPAETLATLIARDRAATDGTDPLVLLAPDHPEFVADQLRLGYRLLVDGELDYSSRFDRDLVVDVADRNPAAIDGVPELLAKNIPNGDVRETMAALVDAHPDLAAHVVPDAFARVEWEPPLRFQHAQLIEATAAHWETVPDEFVETLVETVGAVRSEKHRRFAIRALVALDEAGLSVLPERFSPFIDLYDQGVFEGDDPLDPLQTDAAEHAGLV